MRLVNASMRFGYVVAYGSEKTDFFKMEFAIQLIKRNVIVYIDIRAMQGYKLNNKEFPFHLPFHEL